MIPDPIDPGLTVEALGQVIHSPYALAYLAGLMSGWTLARRLARLALGVR